MYTLRNAIGLLLCGLSLTGCSSTSGLRTGVSPKMRTVASIGDRPLPVVSGAPGSSVAAEDYTPERRSKGEARLSGRVLDEQGDPVPNARVRLAVSGVSGGKVVRATTDKSGAFTLHGVRPGSSCTVIAESDDDRGVMTGRAQARASDTDVRISLAAPDVTPSAPSRSSAARRVSPIANTKADDINDDGDDDDDDDDDDEEEQPTARVKREAAPPPAPEAESISPRKARPARVETRASGSARWRRGESTAAPAPSRSDADAVLATVPESHDPDRAGTARADTDDPPLDDDGPNPLPPALEPGQASAPRTSARPGESPSLARSNPRQSKKARRPANSDTAPGAKVTVPETYTAITLAEKTTATQARTPTTRPAGPASSPDVFGEAPASSRPREAGPRRAPSEDVFAEAVPSSGGSRPLPSVDAASGSAGASLPPPSDPFATLSATAEAPTVAAVPEKMLAPFEPVPAADPAPRRRWRELTASLPGGPVQLDKLVPPTGTDSRRR